MIRRACAFVAVCLSTVANAQPVAETVASPYPETKGLNLLLSGLVTSERGGSPFGFLLGGGYEFPIGSFVDINAGMSFQRFSSLAGPVTAVSVLDVTARKAPTAVSFGMGLGPVFALGNVRPGVRMFTGVEKFHQGTVPIQLSVELLMKFCDDNGSATCPVGEKQTWFLGRLGVRL